MADSYISIESRINLARIALSGKQTFLGLYQASEADLIAIANELGDLLHKVESFSLSESTAEQLPEVLISAMPNLAWLELNSGSLRELPESLVSLQKLELISVTDNNLEELPDWLSQLPKLHTVLASDNQIRTMPGNLDEWKRLFYLRLSDNPISGDLTDLPLPTNLSELWLGNTNITALPAELSNCPNLCELGVPPLVKQVPTIDTPDIQIYGFDPETTLPEPAGTFGVDTPSQQEPGESSIGANKKSL